MTPAIFRTAGAFAARAGRAVTRLARYAGRPVTRLARYAGRVADMLIPRWLRIAMEACASVLTPWLVTRRLGRIIRAVMPPWMLTVFAVCIVIPGPFDELAMIITGVILAGVRYRRTASAWRGGKSHRAYDARHALTDLPDVRNITRTATR